MFRKLFTHIFNERTFYIAGQPGIIHIPNAEGLSEPPAAEMGIQRLPASTVPGAVVAGFSQPQENKLLEPEGEVASTLGPPDPPSLLRVSKRY